MIAGAGGCERFLKGFSVYTKNKGGNLKQREEKDMCVKGLRSSSFNEEAEESSYTKLIDVTLVLNAKCIPVAGQGRIAWLCSGGDK